MAYTSVDRKLLSGELGFVPVGAHTKNAAISSAVTLTKPTGAISLWLQATGTAIRFRLDGTNPDATTGFQIAAGDFLVFPVSGATVRIVEEEATATIQYQWLS